MTAGHEHRVIEARSRNTWWLRLLCVRLLHSRRKDRVERSSFAYAVCIYTQPESPTCWTLTPLGILHGWFGLTVRVPPQEPKRVLRPYFKELIGGD